MPLLHPHSQLLPLKLLAATLPMLGMAHMGLFLLSISSSRSRLGCSLSFRGLSDRRAMNVASSSFPDSHSGEPYRLPRDLPLQLSLPLQLLGLTRHHLSVSALAAAPPILEGCFECLFCTLLSISSSRSRPECWWVVRSASYERGLTVVSRLYFKKRQLAEVFWNGPRGRVVMLGASSLFFRCRDWQSMVEGLMLSVEAVG